MPLPNVGAEKAAAAAEAVGGTVLLPQSTLTDRGTDCNDYAAQHGKAAVRASAQAQFGKYGIELPAMRPEAAPAAAVTQAARDAARGGTRRQPKQAPSRSAAQEAARRAQSRPTGPVL